MLRVIQEDKEYVYDTEYEMWWLVVSSIEWLETNINPLTLPDITIIRDECCELCKSFDKHNTKNIGVSTNYKGEIDEPDEFACNKYEEKDL